MASGNLTTSDIFGDSISETKMGLSLSKRCFKKLLFERECVCATMCVRVCVRFSVCVFVLVRVCVSVSLPFFHVACSDVSKPCLSVASLTVSELTLPSIFWLCQPTVNTLTTSDGKVHRLLILGFSHELFKLCQAIRLWSNCIDLNVHVNTREWSTLGESF